MYFSSAWDVVTTKEGIDNTSNSKIDKIFSYRLSPSHRYLAYSSYHFSINLDIERLQFCKVFERDLSIFVQICGEKQFLRRNMEGNKKGTNFVPFHDLYV